MGKEKVHKGPVSDDEQRKLLRYKEKELVLKVSKEIVIKFIETGGVSPSSFEEAFRMIYRGVTSAIGEKNG